MNGHNFEMKFNMFGDESLTGNPAFPADLKSGLTKPADVRTAAEINHSPGFAFRKKKLKMTQIFGQHLGFSHFDKICGCSPFTGLQQLK